MAPSGSAIEAKRALRAAMLQRRASIPGAQRPAAALALARHGIAFLGPDPGALVAGYVAIRDEIDPLPLVEAISSRGHRLALPVVEEPDAALVFRSWAPGDELRKGRLGVPEPSASSPAVVPDIVLVPLVAFDLAGYRLGLGVGFYDRTLAALRAQREIAAVGLAFDEQQAGSVPHEPHDARLDWVLTPSGPRDVRRGT